MGTAERIADKLITLINSKPRSPNRDEIVEVVTSEIPQIAITLTADCSDVERLFAGLLEPSIGYRPEWFKG